VTASIEVRVPDIGGSKDVAVIELLAKPGESIGKDQGLLTLESDKATMEVPAPVAGLLKEWKVKVGDSVAEGQLLALLEAEADRAEAARPRRRPRPRRRKPRSPHPPRRRQRPRRAIRARAAGEVRDGKGADIDCQLVVLGAGPGGYTAAFRGADLGSTWCWSSATRNWVASASTSAAFPPRRCCTRRDHRRGKACGQLRPRLRHAEARPRQAARAQGQGGAHDERRPRRHGEAAQGARGRRHRPLRLGERAGHRHRRRQQAPALRALHHRRRLAGGEAARLPWDDAR
jgi:pyruvate/2-oxoglutarate dehydrogenase complex dihydrolipoamide acyltransferase (E2) component